MIYKPSYANPYLTPIDATKDNVFSCYLNADGGTQINKYNLTIKSLTGTQVFTTGDVTLSPVLYNQNTLNITVPSSSTMINGVDYIWNIKLYESDPTIWVTYGTVQTGSTTTTINIRKQYNVFAGMYLKIGNEIRQISTYSSTTGVAVVNTAFSIAPTNGTPYTVYTNYVISDDVYFKARKSPVVDISNFLSTITNKAYTFNGSYSQDDGVAWKYYTWKLYNNGDEVIKIAEQINTGEIKFFFDGFLSNTTYKIELIVETQDGVIVTSGIKTFNVQYTEPSLVNVSSVENICEKDAFRVSWEDPSLNLYTITGDYEFLPNKLFLNSTSVNLKNTNTVLDYAISNSLGEVLIPYLSTTSMYCKFPDGFSGEFYRQTNINDGGFYSISCTGRSFVYNINNHYIGTINISYGESWLLNPLNVFDPIIAYIWNDTAIWDDTMYWTEGDGDVLYDFTWKITLLPDGVKLRKITNEYKSCFSPPNTIMYSSSKLFKDYALNKTDVLYK